MRRPLFIVGVGRSGTTLVQNMFASHPAVAALPETGIVRRVLFDGGWASRPVAGPQLEVLRSRDHRIGRMDDETWNRGAAAIEAGATTGGAWYRALGGANAAGREEAASSPVRFVLDKDPRLIEYLPRLLETFPDAEIIHVVRDPRDVLLSKSKASWSKDRPWTANAMAGLVQLRAADRLAGDNRKWRVHVLRYESLLVHPEDELTRVCHELDLDYASSMLEYGDAARRLAAPDELAWKREAQGPVLTENRDKWRKGLTPVQIAACDRIFRGWMRRYGYEQSPRRKGDVAGAVAALAVRAGAVVYRATHRHLRGNATGTRG